MFYQIRLSIPTLPYSNKNQKGNHILLTLFERLPLSFFLTHTHTHSSHTHSKIKIKNQKNLQALHLFNRELISSLSSSISLKIISNVHNYFWINQTSFLSSSYWWLSFQRRTTVGWCIDGRDLKAPKLDN